MGDLIQTKLKKNVHDKVSLSLSLNASQNSISYMSRNSIPKDNA